ncbi:hypothetical protein I0Q91_04695 [Halanaerobiaceae bacterium Z-7014]|uniref:Uncharacterized protein n=1 Tax=Halonatronomonas betaini TaxID=2778430 RepID=A0A931ATV8_9FIRM|nr:hypothetical protein [Halonatronomonas betaini]MBF8436370.1 hypothetical protein [Halonatronomonas betaini]
MILFKTGFLTLNLFTLILLASFFVGFTKIHPSFYGLILFIIYIGFLYKTKEDWNILNNKEPGEKLFDLKDLYNFFSVVVGGLVTFFLAQELGLTVVLASGLVGVISHLVLPKYEVPIFCGSFVGMASASLLPGYSYLAFAGIIAGIVYVLGKFSFNGFGGKLGTTAFIGCVLAAIFTGQEFVVSSIPQGSLAVQILIYSVIGAVLTFVLNVRLKNSAVISSGLVGVLAAIILPVIHPANGATLAVMVYCASFAGMSAKHRISNELQMIIAGIIAGLIFIYTSPYLGGAGGKLGTTAFASVITVNGLSIIFNRSTVKLRSRVLSRLPDMINLKESS